LPATADELKAALPEADVLLASFLWRNEYAEAAPRLRFIQSISAGTDQFSREVLKSRGIRLASAQGANERVVAEHAIALILAMTRHLGQARDNQHERRWAGMISDPTARQQELGGRTLVIVGLGRIGTRLATLARAFDLEVIGVRRSPRTADDIVDEVVPPDRLLEVLPRADFLALTCPLTPETERLIRAEHFAAMKFGAYLINVARGKVVDEPALIEALSAGRIAGAGLDCFVEEPLPQDSPLWSFPNVLVTPHSAGETNRYEANVISIFSENLDRLARGEELRNGIL
jgi:phosphoglycerate dehydrogenase-like enzyme